jgi:hypothetical protein
MMNAAGDVGAFGGVGAVVRLGEGMKTILVMVVCWSHAGQRTRLSLKPMRFLILLVYVVKVCVSCDE